LGAQDVIGEVLNEKQRKPTQKKRHQSSRVLPRERSTVRNSEKLRKKAVLQLEIRCSIRLSYGRTTKRRQT
jgi:hypothetical protein